MIQEELRCQGVQNSDYSEECLRNLEKITFGHRPGGGTIYDNEFGKKGIG